MTNMNGDEMENLLPNNNEKLEEWSDLKCIKISMEDYFPIGVTDINTQKCIVNRFLNFYLSGKIPKGLSVTDVIFSSIAIMPRSIQSEEVMWSQEQYSENGTLFFLSPEDKLQAEIRKIVSQRNTENEQKEEHPAEIQKTNKEYSDCVTSNNPGEELEQKGIDNDCVQETTLNVESISESELQHDMKKSNKDDELESNSSEENIPTIFKNMRWYKRYVNSNIPLRKVIDYGPLENAAFCASCNTFLEKWDSDSQARKYLKFFFGLTALVLMRTLTKSYEKVLETFLITFHKYCYFPYSSPDTACIKKCFKTFRRFDRKIQIMFSKLVLNSFVLDHTAYEGKIKNVIKLGVLSHTVFFKMDLLNMIQNLAYHTNSYFHIAIEVICEAEELADSSKRVCDFLKKYVSLSDTNYFSSCYWARVIEREQFEYMTCRENYKFAVVIAVFIEKLSFESGVWNAAWVRNSDNLHVTKQLGIKLYELYKRRIDVESSSRLRQRLFSCAFFQPDLFIK